MTQSKALKLAKEYGMLTADEIHAGGPESMVIHYAHEAASYGRQYLRLRSQAAGRRAVAQAYRDCGMVRVRGALGGVYYE